MQVLFILHNFTKQPLVKLVLLINYFMITRYVVIFLFLRKKSLKIYAQFFQPVGFSPSVDSNNGCTVMIFNFFFLFWRQLNLIKSGTMRSGSMILDSFGARRSMFPFSCSLSCVGVIDESALLKNGDPLALFPRFGGTKICYIKRESLRL